MFLLHACVHVEVTYTEMYEASHPHTHPNGGVWAEPESVFAVHVVSPRVSEA